MIKLIYEVPEQHKKYTATERIEMTLSCEDSLSSVLDSVKDFLKAVGFGYIEELDYTTAQDQADSNKFTDEDVLSPLPGVSSDSIKFTK